TQVHSPIREALPRRRDLTVVEGSARSRPEAALDCTRGAGRRGGRAARRRGGGRRRRGRGGGGDGAFGEPRLPRTGAEKGFALAGYVPCATGGGRGPTCVRDLVAASCGLVAPARVVRYC